MVFWDAVGAVAEFAREIALHRDKNAVPYSRFTCFTSWGQLTKINDFPFGLDMYFRNEVLGPRTMRFPDGL
jgi:hypothetical protein